MDIARILPPFMDVFDFAGPYPSVHLNRKNLTKLVENFPEADAIGKIPGFDWKVKKVRNGQSLIASVVMALWEDIPWLKELGPVEYWMIRTITSYIEPDTASFNPPRMECHLGLQIPITAKRNIVVAGMSNLKFSIAVSHQSIEHFGPK